MLITPAFAQDAAAGGNDIFIQMLPFVFIFVIIYLLIIRPQQKRVRVHKDMVAAIRRGDTVITSGGLIGKVTKVADDKDEIQVELAKDLKVNVVRSMVQTVRVKGEPASKS